jgi:[ribosomal protein S5]-alanine N-acetyltransferase
MKIVIDTQRLLLREIIPNDAETFYLLNSSPEVMRFTGDEPFTSIEEAKTFLKNYPDYERNGFGRWAVVLKDNGNIIGWCGLKLNEEKEIDLGYRLFKEHWGKGFATESANACLDYGFNILGFKRIIGRVDRENIASKRVLEKIGMQFWKEAPCGSIGDALYYKIDAP